VLIAPTHEGIAKLSWPGFKWKRRSDYWLLTVRSRRSRGRWNCWKLRQCSWSCVTYSTGWQFMKTSSMLPCCISQTADCCCVDNICLNELCSGVLHSGNVLVSVDIVGPCWYWDGWPGLSHIRTILICNLPFRLTQPGHPSASIPLGWCNDYWRGLQSLLGEKWQSG